MPDIEITSVGSYLNIIESLMPDHRTVYYRGQCNKDWKIESSISRQNKAIEQTLVEQAKGDINQAEAAVDFIKMDFTRRIHQEFVDNYPSYPEVNLLQDYKLNDIDMMMVSQHYGLPTRLIDWSLSPLVALFFATLDEPTIDASVFALSDTTKSSEYISLSSSQKFLNTFSKEKKNLDHVRKWRKFYEGATVNFNEIDDTLNKSNDNCIFHPPLSLCGEFHSHKIYFLCLHASLKMQGSDNRSLSKILKHAIPDDLMLNSLREISTIKIFSAGHYFIKPLPLNQRIKNQQGVFHFSASPYEADSINKLAKELDKDLQPPKETENIHLIKIIIPAQYKEKIHNELVRYGISRDFIYPEIDNYAKEMPRRIANELLHTHKF
ncbi:FRG domain-containing protein [Pseudomonas serboccidentalis]